MRHSHVEGTSNLIVCLQRSHWIRRTTSSLQIRNFERLTISPGERGKCAPASERANTTDVIDRDDSGRMQGRNVHDHASRIRSSISE